MNVLDELTEVLEQRKQAPANSSYVASLYASGLNRILEKVGEEATEVILAARDVQDAPNGDKRQALVGEVADLWFHSLVMLAHLDLNAQAVTEELARRFGISGLEEKAGRSG